MLRTKSLLCEPLRRSRGAFHPLKDPVWTADIAYALATKMTGHARLPIRIHNTHFRRLDQSLHCNGEGVHL